MLRTNKYHKYIFYVLILYLIWRTIQIINMFFRQHSEPWPCPQTITEFQKVFCFSNSYIWQIWHENIVEDIVGYFSVREQFSDKKSQFCDWHI